MLISQRSPGVLEKAIASLWLAGYEEGAVSLDDLFWLEELDVHFLEQRKR